jgi:glycosyltransferase involved in cell wall biosynthesis
MLNSPSFTFVIPIYNSGYLLTDCLESIKSQDYQKDKIEIICPDGGSQDEGLQIAKRFGARVVKNPKVLAEPGFMLGASKAVGDLVVYMGADNRLVEKDWIKKMAKPFSDPKIMGAYPRLRNNSGNSWFTKYFNAFTDPVNHFSFGSACNPLYFHKYYQTLKKTNDYVVYKFSANDYPMLAFDQGFVARKSYKRPKDTEYDDIMPVIDMILNKMQIAYVPGASNYHNTLDMGFSQFIKKMRWSISNNLKPTPELGFITRKKYASKRRRFLVMVWPIYAISLVGPLAMSLYGFIRDKKTEWFYHLPITFIMLLLVTLEIFRMKVFSFGAREVR